MKLAAESEYVPLAWSLLRSRVEQELGDILIADVKYARRAHEHHEWTFTLLSRSGDTWLSPFALATETNHYRDDCFITRLLSVTSITNFLRRFIHENSHTR